MDAMYDAAPDTRERWIPREPTEAMLSAGRAKWMQFNTWAGIENRETAAGLVWQAMYDAWAKAKGADK